MTVDLEDRVQRVEYAIWGLQGNNGLMSEMRGLRKDLSDYRAEEAARREREAAERRAAEADKRKTSRGERVLLTIAGLGFFGTAITIVLQLTGSI